MKRILFVPVVLSVVFLSLIGCSSYNRNEIVLCTNIPEMAAYIEYFNAKGWGINVELYYNLSPVTALSGKNGVPDLIIGPDMTGRSALENLYSLENVFKDDGIDRGSFYKGLLSPGIYDNKQVAIPVCFNIPTVIYNSECLKEVPNLSISLDYMKEQSGDFNQIVQSQFKRMGFSPLWNYDFLYLCAVHSGADFREADDMRVVWNEESLDAGVKFIRSWVDEANKGYDLSRVFTHKYMYEPVSKLIDEKRVLFYYSNSLLLFQNLKKHKEEVDFRWLGNKAGICVEEEVLYAGIPQNAKNKKGARSFLYWFFNGKTQELLLKISQKKRLEEFGICGGFSALKDVTECVFPQYYPKLIGRIPSADLIKFPAHLPVNWNRLKEKVVVPYLLEAITSTGDPEKLKKAIDTYN